MASAPTPLFRKGIIDALPIFAGYFAVGFALGAAGSAGGLPVWAQTLASLLNFSGTSQTAIVRMAGDAGILAIVLACIALNLRYILLSLAIAQRLAGGHGFWHRCLIAGCVTDEVVAMSLLRTEPLRLSYLLGLAVCSLTGWVGGTACGAWGAGWLPPSALKPLCLAPYAMFVAILVPAARQSGAVLRCLVLAMVLNGGLHALPAAIRPGSSAAMLLSGVVAAALFAWRAPAEETEETEAPDGGSASTAAGNPSTPLHP